MPPLAAVVVAAVGPTDAVADALANWYFPRHMFPVFSAYRRDIFTFL